MIIKRTYFDVKLDALILKNRALASEATAFAYQEKKQSIYIFYFKLPASSCHSQVVRIIEYLVQVRVDR
jgi:hypothetical protein